MRETKSAATDLERYPVNDLSSIDEEILIVLQEGPAAARAVCSALKLDYPGQMERVRNRLNGLVRKGLVKKSYKGARNAQEQCFSLAVRLRTSGDE